MSADDERVFLNPSLADKYVLVVGAYFSDVDSRYQEVRDDGEDSARLDLEALGLDDDDVLPYIYGRVRLADRWQLELI